jgi:hypothetical protein
LGQATSNRYSLAAILDANLPAYAVICRIVRGSQRQSNPDDNRVALPASRGRSGSWRGIIVHDQVVIKIGRNIGFDLAEEVAELGRPAAGTAFADHVSVAMSGAANGDVALWRV